MKIPFQTKRQKPYSKIRSHTNNNHTVFFTFVFTRMFVKSVLRFLHDSSPIQFHSLYMTFKQKQSVSFTNIEIIIRVQLNVRHCSCVTTVTINSDFMYTPLIMMPIDYIIHDSIPRS